MLKETKAKDTPWNYGQRVKNFVEYLMPKHLPPTTLDGFTLPKHKNAGRKNWIRKEKILKILEAADNDRDLKFALLCGFDAGLRREAIAEAKVNWFDREDGLLHVPDDKLILS